MGEFLGSEFGELTICLPNLPHFGIQLGFHNTLSTFRFSGIEIVRNRADTFSTFRFSSSGIEESRNRALVSLGPGTELGTETGESIASRT